jgi:AcrR family transcriptional regulator
MRIPDAAVARRPAAARRPVAARSTAGVRREEIIEAAVSEFAFTGLHGTATEAIARRAGVSQPYLFRLFGTKKALFCATIERSFDRTRDEFAECAERARAEGVHPFALMGRRYVEMLADREQVLLQMQAYVASSDPEVRAVVQRRYGELYEWLESIEPDPALIHAFVSTGMFLNVAAAIDLPGIAGVGSWASRCLDVPLPAPATPQPTAPTDQTETVP